MSFPRWRRNGVRAATRSLIWRAQAGGSRTPLPEEQVGLTMAGLARVDPAAADRLAQMISRLAAREANLPPNPSGVREANEPINDLLTEFLKSPPRAGRTSMNLRTGAELLMHEYISIASETGRQRIYEARLGGANLAPFRGMETVGVYLDRITALAPTESPQETLRRTSNPSVTAVGSKWPRFQPDQSPTHGYP